MNFNEINNNNNYLIKKEKQQQFNNKNEDYLIYKKIKKINIKNSDNDSGYAINELYNNNNNWKTKSELIYNYYFSSKYLFLNFNKKISKLLEYQLPLQDISENYCLNLKNNKERYKLAEFAFKRKQNYFGQGIIKKLKENKKEIYYCKQCKLKIKTKSLIITAISHFGLFTYWHLNCFVCFECKELLINLIYFVHQNNIFCGRHHAELIRPRCVGCDELIFGEEYTQAEGKIWHLNHFSCLKCNKSLAGSQYIMKSNKNKQFPFCLFCYNNNNNCLTCLNEINKNQPYIILQNNQIFKWHANSNCFCCSICKKELFGISYSFFNGKLFCGNQNKCKNNKYYFNKLPKCFPPPLPKSNPPPLPPPDIQLYFQSSTSSENYYETVIAPLIIPNNKRKEVKGNYYNIKDSICSSSSSLILSKRNNYFSEIYFNNKKEYINKKKKKQNNNKYFTKRRCKSADCYQNKKIKNNLEFSSPFYNSFKKINKQNPITENNYSSSESEEYNNSTTSISSISSESDDNNNEQISANALFLHHYFSIIESESLNNNNINSTKKMIKLNNFSNKKNNERCEFKKNISNCRIS